jgi:hypothetical protein
MTGHASPVTCNFRMKRSHWESPSYRRSYGNLATADPIAALRHAQTQVMDTITGAHWAAFVLQGWSTG